MWPGMVVVDDVLTYEAQEVALVQNDDVVEALVPEGFNHALRYPVRLWATKRAEHGRDPYRPRPNSEGSAETGITVSNQIQRLVSPGRCLDQLARDPVGGGMSGDVHVNEPSSAVVYEEENIEGAKGQRRHGEEVTSPDVDGMIPQEGAPSL